MMEPTLRKHLTVILNRESGTIMKLGPDEVATELQEIFEKLGSKAEIQKVNAKEVQEALETARDGDSDAVIVGGGDGTVASAATIFAGHEKPLGILPFGTFNLAARDVGMPLDWREAAKLLVVSPMGEMDALEVNGKLYLCLVVLGFYPSLAIGQAEYHGSWIVKSIRTLWSSFKSAATFPPLRLRLSNGDSVQSYRTRLALMANNDYEDIFGIIPTRRTLDAGYFTVYISKHGSRLGFLKSCVTWIMGRWKEDREIAVLRATELEINVKRQRRVSVMMDGELEKITLPFTVKIRPKALRAIIPKLSADTIVDP